MNKTTLATFFTLIILTLVLLLKETKTDNIILKDKSVILAFGDSLTYGFGADYNSSYPRFIESKTTLKVINAGVNGELTSEGLARLPKFLAHKPDLVILCHGGNDILNKRSEEELKANLLAMIKLVRESGAKVLLVGVPDFSLFSFDTHDVYEEVVEETGVMFEDEILTYIETKRALKSDYVHPNAKGYELMADAFIEILNLNK